MSNKNIDKIVKGSEELKRDLKNPIVVESSSEEDARELIKKEIKKKIKKHLKLK